MNAAYFFVAATVLAVLPIAFLYKISLERLIENASAREKVQTNFFIWVALIEALPIVLIVLGFMNLEPVGSFDELMMPGLIVVTLMAFGIIFIFLQRLARVPEEIKETVNTFTGVGLVLINSIPIISIVALLTMMPA